MVGGARSAGPLRPEPHVGAKPDAAYCEKFFNRTKDLVDKYQPDLLYFDDGVLPLNGSDPAYGLCIAAHYYNSSTAWHGSNEAVMNTKGLNDEQRKALVWDIERGKSDRLEPYPWQTDTCIGSWHYNRGIYRKHGYKTPATVIPMLVDIVSKNGNLLLNVPVRGDGTIDEDEVEVPGRHRPMDGDQRRGDLRHPALEDLRRRHPRGEGGQFNEGKGRPYTAEDIRFTTKGNTLYVFVLAWPADGKLVVKTLGAEQSGIRGDVTGVELLGAGEVGIQSRAGRAWSSRCRRSGPANTAWALKIEGLDLAASQPGDFITVVPFFVEPDKKGNLQLQRRGRRSARQEIHAQGHGGKGTFNRWDNPQDWASWEIEVASPGKYKNRPGTPRPKATANSRSKSPGRSLLARPPRRAVGTTCRNIKLGRIELEKAGKYTVSVRRPWRFEVEGRQPRPRAVEEMCERTHRDYHFAGCHYCPWRSPSSSRSPSLPTVAADHTKKPASKKPAAQPSPGAAVKLPEFTGQFLDEPTASPGKLCLWYTRPAAKWTEALPAGNGHMGAMVYGGVDTEQIQFNEHTVWTGQPHDYAHKGRRNICPKSAACCRKAGALMARP